MTKKKVKDSIKINPKNPRPAIVNYGKEVGKKIDTQMKKYGYIEYMETIGNDQVSYFRYYKHPHKIAKICFSVKSIYDTIEEELGLGEKIVISEVELALEIRRAVNETPMHKDMSTSSYSGNLKTFHKENPKKDRISLNSRISIKSVIDDLLEDVSLMDLDTIAEWDEAIRRNGVESVFGKFGKNNSDFASLDDIRQFFIDNWEDGTAAIVGFEFEELYPDSVKDIFIF